MSIEYPWAVAPGEQPGLVPPLHSPPVTAPPPRLDPYGYEQPPWNWTAPPVQPVEPQFSPPADNPVVAPVPHLPEQSRLVAERGPVKVSVDNKRCHIYGICQQEAPEVFRIAENGSLHYTAAVQANQAAQARQAARCCPMQAITVRAEAPAPRRRASRSGVAGRVGHRRIVVAGAGLAGLSAATRLRERGFDGELVMVGEETQRPYSRPPLSKQYLTGELRSADLTFRADESLDAHWLLGTRMTGLDTRRRTVELPGDEQLPYDGLVIATGVDAKRLPEAPLFSNRIRTVRTLADAAALRQAMSHAQARHVVILGGGFVGCELACTARELGLDVTLVVHSGPLLRRVLGRTLGEVMGRVQARAGVSVRLNTQVTDWRDLGSVLRLRLDDGTTIDADFVVLGLGGVPRTEWLRGSGLDTGDGVLCDATCHVLDTAGRPVPGVVAAGDVARWPNRRFDAVPRRVEHLIHAVEMGQHAADALLLGADRAPAFTPTPRFWSEQHGMRLQAVGLPALGERMEIVEGSLRSEEFIALYTRGTPEGEQLVAAVALEMPRRLLEYRDRIGGIHSNARPATRAARRRRR